MSDVADGPTRALVLAGGGIRVAWQTGVVAALRERGLEFAHGDGTSGGIFTLGMLLSGIKPPEMVERWRELPARAFVSLLPARSYLRPMTDWQAFGSADGVRERVLPALGIDLAAIRCSQGMTGSFNVGDFASKRCVPVPHTELDEDLLVAGVSLAALMPAVPSQGRIWTDAVWMQDANLMEAVRRGCDELWVAWCIGNTPRWGRGALEQYVHMIEMSATAALVSELERITELNTRRAAGEPVLGSTRPIRVHVVRPALPLPLDPDFVTGRIDAETLVAQGYRDAYAYLATAAPDGVPLDATATATPARRLGARRTLRANGTLGPGRQEASCSLVVEADDLMGLATRTATTTPCVGGFTHPQHGYCMLKNGTARLVGPSSSCALHMTGELLLDETWHRLSVTVPLPAGRWGLPRAQLWELQDQSGAVVAQGSGHASPLAALQAATTFEPSGAHDLRDRVRALRLARRVVRQGGRLPVAGAP